MKGRKHRNRIASLKKKEKLKERLDTERGTLSNTLDKLEQVKRKDESDTHKDEGAGCCKADDSPPTKKVKESNIENPS